MGEFPTPRSLFSGLEGFFFKLGGGHVSLSAFFSSGLYILPKEFFGFFFLGLERGSLKKNFSGGILREIFSGGGRGGKSILNFNLEYLFIFSDN